VASGTFQDIPRIANADQLRIHWTVLVIIAVALAVRFLFPSQNAQQAMKISKRTRLRPPAPYRLRKTSHFKRTVFQRSAPKNSR